MLWPVFTRGQTTQQGHSTAQGHTAQSNIFFKKIFDMSLMVHDNHIYVYIP